MRQLVDAEQTYFQDAIDFFTLFFMLKYNKESSVVWGTYQMYRKDTMDRLRTHGKISEQLDIHFAFKVNFLLHFFSFLVFFLSVIFSLCLLILNNFIDGSRCLHE